MLTIDETTEPVKRNFNPKNKKYDPFVRPSWQLRPRAEASASLMVNTALSIILDASQILHQNFPKNLLLKKCIFFQKVKFFVGF